MSQIDTQSQIGKLWDAINDIKGNPPLLDHFHTGFDVSQVSWGDLSNRYLYIQQTIYGTDAATAANYSTFWIAPFTVQVTNFYEVHATAGTDGSAVTLQLEKLTGTQAPGAGNTMLSTALSLKATINTVQTATLTTTLANRSLAKGNRLALLKAGTLTSVANVTVLVELQVI